MPDPFELPTAPAPGLAEPVPVDEPPVPEQCRFTFTGSGKEYFRIWIVNLALTVATLGIYSAWAKVRRLQYFDRNTTLAGASFDFHGDPKAILKGRLLGVLLLVLYHYGFGFSLTVGVVVAAALLLALPFLMHSALRFRLSNTSYRALPFGFDGSIRGAYLAYLPPAAVVLLPGALLVLDRSGLASGVGFLLYFGWPFMHAAMKRYQHAHLLYGQAHSAYAVPARRFVGAYVRAVLLGLAGVVCAAVVVGIASFIAFTSNSNHGLFARIIGFTGVAGGYLIVLLSIPYLQARFANLVWNNTTFPGLRFESTLSARRFARLQAANVALTLLTLGLYRPFAVVRVYRYRLACISVLSEGGFEEIAAGTGQRSGAGGDAVAELLGFDLSW